MTQSPLGFLERLHARWRTANSLLCVGLDPDPQRLPAHLLGHRDGVFEFCRDIVDATADLVCAFKPQIAYFSSQRAEEQLERVIGHIRAHYPDVPVILDAKRGDIGSTAEQYAREAFERYRADAVTLSPFMGLDSLQPFFAYRDRGTFLLCRTSNAGGGDLQTLDVGGEKLFERIARLAATTWNVNGQLGLVVGATFPEELARVRGIVGGLPLLVPGIGAQGGDIEATLRAGCVDGVGLVLNSSRAILYAGSDEGFAAAAAVAARTTRDSINAGRRLVSAH